MPVGDVVTLAVPDDWPVPDEPVVFNLDRPPAGVFVAGWRWGGFVAHPFDDVTVQPAGSARVRWVRHSAVRGGQLSMVVEVGTRDETRLRAWLNVGPGERFVCW